MTTSTVSLLEDYLNNATFPSIELSTDINYDEVSPRSSSFFMFITKWLLRLSCISIIVICSWANYKLIEYFQRRSFYKESSAKWYIIFKAVFDTFYIVISIPIILFLTFNIDIIHKNFFTCRVMTYLHYLSDDLISMMLTLLCIDRMLRITCGLRLRTRFSLTVCIVTLSLFAIINIHHIVRLQHTNGFCHKTYNGMWDYQFDIYYSFIYTSITWTVIFIASINLTVSVYCDRTRRIQLKKQQEQQQKISKIFVNGGEPIGADSDRIELIHSTDDWEDSTAITIDQNNMNLNRSSEQEQQDNIDLQLTVCVLITSAIFLSCNLPNFIMFVMRFIYRSQYLSSSYVLIYISLVPLLVAHTISYFVFNHLARRLFPNISS